MQIQYHLAPVDIDAKDVEWLWGEIIGLFQPGVNLDTSFRVGSGKWPREFVVENTDVGRLLASGLLAENVNELTLRFASFFNPGIPDRGLELVIESQARTWVKIEGEREWILQLRGLLDGYLEQRKNRDRWLRWAAMAFWWGLPLASFIYAGLYSDSPVFDWAAVVWLPLGLPFWFIASRAYPLSRIAIDSRGLRRPWYIRLGRELFVAVMAAIVASIIIAFLIAPFFLA